MVCGECYAGVKASLPGYRRRKLRHEVYPAISPCSEETVEGLLCFAVSAEALRVLDRYEGAQYQRCTVRVDTAMGRAVHAQTYVLATNHEDELSDEGWDLATFVERDKAAYLSGL